MKTEKQKHVLSSKLLDWWSTHSRNYPWRETRDPYSILIAEVMLHRTRANQVLKIYSEFVERFPNAEALARASRSEVRKILYPLGLRWRADLMHKMAKEIHLKHRDVIPREMEDLTPLPGVSTYIAGAVLSFAFGRQVSILDTNTVRITGRIFGIRISESSRRSEDFRRLYDSIRDRKHSREFNLAMIDLAALVCRPANPLCNQCPIRSYCEFRRSRVVAG